MTGGHVVILRYHSVLPPRSELAHRIGEGIVHETDQFEEHMALLSKTYNVVTMDEVSELFHGNNAPPRRSVCVTFDDGFWDNYQYAAPIMERYGLRGTFYVTAGCMAGSSPPWFCRLRYAVHMTKIRFIRRKRMLWEKTR
jgi:peptidoglycan/xylan/chitin deacetylase (PgdA/CDA1 family)